MFQAMENSNTDVTAGIGWRLPSRRSVKRAAYVMLFLAGAAAASTYGYRYWTVGQYLQSTDDAYVKADFTVIAPKVAGYIANVLVEDNQPVKAGQVLARIDDRDFRTALDQARADVTAAEAAIRNLDAQLELQQSTIDQQKADIVGAEAASKFADVDQARYRNLMQSGFGSVQRAQQTAAASSEKRAAVAGNQAALAAAQKKIDVLTTERAQLIAQAERDRAIAHQAELNLSYTTVSAPVDGTVGARALRVGQYVQAGSQLMAVVPLRAVYVVANFKETQLTYVRQGQPVEVDVDSFPGVKLEGHVDSLSPASGLEFSLLPPDNATGNFTKIVQRIPVKIVFNNDQLAGLLRSGMSVTPTIDTKQTTEEAKRQNGDLIAALAASAKQGS
jgi:membrane fusion protein (multidrug efflux system)